MEKMNKKKLFVISPSDSREKIYKKFVLYLQKQGIKIVKGSNDGR